MAASATDLFRQATPLFQTTLETAMLATDTSATLSSTLNLPTTTGVTITIDEFDSTGNPTPALREVMTGVVSASTLINLIRGQDGTTAQAHSAGAIVQQTFTAQANNDLMNGLLTTLTQSGALLPASVTNAMLAGGITGSNLANATITATQIANATITATQIANSSAATLINPYKFKVTRAAAWNTPNNAGATVIFDTKVYDTGTNYSTSTGMFTAPIAGFYHFDYNLSGVTVTSGSLFGACLFHNGSADSAGDSVLSSNSSGGYWGLSSGSDIQMAVNDTVNVTILDASGGAGGTGSNTTFSGHLISAT